MRRTKSGWGRRARRAADPRRQAAQARDRKQGTLVLETRYLGPRYCETCGSAMELVHHDTGRYDPQTGQRIVLPYASCPNHKMKHEWRNLLTPPPPSDRG